MARYECIWWAAETGFLPRADQKLSRPPSSTALDAHSTVLTAAAGETPCFFVMTRRLTKAFSPNMRTPLRPAQTRNTGSFPVSAPGADHTRMLDSEQIRAVTIAQRTEYEKTRMKPSTKPMSIKGELFHAWRASHLVLCADLFSCHPCCKCYNS